MSVRADILVVDDDAGIRQTVAECLELEGYPVRQASGGAQALELIGTGGAPALIFLDMVMPSMTGEQLLARLREQQNTADVKIVVMTAATPTADHAGADASLAKPFELAELLAMASRFCGPPPAEGGAPAP